MTVAIEFIDISKRYQLGEVGTGTLAHDLHRLWAKALRRPDPFAKVGQVNDRTKRTRSESDDSHGASDYVWALKDINLRVDAGEILGIIGRNGAGKSTLLKLLSRVTAPTTGMIRARGRIASLLEVGTGFHPELTGRENIFLNGAILGMRHYEIKRQLDDIIDFSGCAKYIDTPVKRYSSGMTVRLGFSVAAHLDCEILIVDEVLAVGDAEFQTKCLGRMREISSEVGKTVLFVSHNLDAMLQICTRAILMQHGQIANAGTVQSMISDYLESEHSRIELDKRVALGAANVSIKPEEAHLQIASGQSADLSFRLSASDAVTVNAIAIVIQSTGGTRVGVLDLRRDVCPFDMRPEHHYNLKGTIDSLSLVEGQYSIAIYLKTPLHEVMVQDVVMLSITPAIDLRSHISFSAKDRGFCEFRHQPFSFQSE